MDIVSEEKTGAPDVYFSRTYNTIQELRKNPPSYMNRAFVKFPYRWTKTQMENSALIAGDEWFDLESSFREQAATTPVLTYKDRAQKESYEQIAHIIGPHLDDPEFMRLVVSRLRKNFEEAFPETKELFKKEFLTPANPMELWYPAIASQVQKG